MTAPAASLASVIDHTLLAPTALREDILRLCAEADQVSAASVCVNPIWVATASAALQDSTVPVCAVVGFPFGSTPSEVKAAEASAAVADGATEIDMVIHHASAVAGDQAALMADISAVVQAVGENVVVKVILETGTLDDDAIVLACQAAEAAGAHFVKTSTGFVGTGATVEAVALMRHTVGDRLGVKASGGIRNRATALAMLDAGATRLGASSTLAILEEDSESDSSDAHSPKGTR